MKIIAHVNILSGSEMGLGLSNDCLMFSTPEILQLKSTAKMLWKGLTMCFYKHKNVDVYALVSSVHESRVTSNTQKCAVLLARSCDLTA